MAPAPTTMLRLAALAASCRASLGGGAPHPESAAGAAGVPKSPPAALDAQRFRAHLQDLEGKSVMSPELRRALRTLDVATAPGGRLRRMNEALDGVLARQEAAIQQGRRLWFWPESATDPSSIAEAAGEFVDRNTDEAQEWVQDTAAFVEEATDSVVNAFASIKSQFGETTGLLDECKIVIDGAWQATTGFGEYMQAIYSSFGEVQPYFANAFGIVPLLSDEDLMRQLIRTIEQLLESSTQVYIIAEAVRLVAVPVKKMQDAMDQGLKSLNNIGGDRRRLITDLIDVDLGEYSSSFDYSNLMAGLDLTKIPPSMEHAVSEAQLVMQDFSKIRDVLRPIIEHIKRHYGGEEEEKEDVGGPEGDGMELANGNETDEAERRLRTEKISQLTRRVAVLDALGVKRGDTSYLNGVDRRLMEHYDEVKKDQAKYEEALGGITPAWRKAEGLTKDTCTQIEVAAKQVDSMVCRLNNFLNRDTIAGPDAVDTITVECDSISRDEVSGEGKCPEKLQSEDIREAFNGSAGFISLAFAMLEYLISNYRPIAFILALVMLFVGTITAFLGYFIKSTIEFAQGCSSGLVTWSMVISFMIVWFDMCRGGSFVPDCDPTWMCVVVLLLSVGCGVVTVKVNYEKAEMILSGFTTGAFAAGVYYIVLFREEILGGVLDAESAKPYMVSLLIVMIFAGCGIGALTMVLFRQLLMMGTAIVGSFLIVCSMLIIIPHWWGIFDWIAWCVLAPLAYLVQLLVTPPDFELLDKEEQEEYKKQYKKTGTADVVP